MGLLITMIIWWLMNRDLIELWLKWFNSRFKTFHLLYYFWHKLKLGIKIIEIIECLLFGNIIIDINFMNVWLIYKLFMSIELIILKCSILVG